MTPPAPPVESTDGRSSQEPAESVFDWADRLLAQFPPEVYEGTVRSSQSSLCDLAFSVPPRGNIGRPEATGGEPGIQRGFHRLCDPPDLITAEIASPALFSDAPHPSFPIFLPSYNWSTSTSSPCTPVVWEPDLAATAFATPPPLPRDTCEVPSMKRTKIYTLRPSHAGDRSSSSALPPPPPHLDAIRTSVDPAAQAGGSISVEGTPARGELEKVQPKHGSTGVRTWFPSFPGAIAVTEARHHSQRQLSPTFPCVGEAAAVRSGAAERATTPKPLAILSRYALDSTGPIVLVTEESFFTPWSNGEASLLTLDGRYGVPFSATIGGPPNFSYDHHVGSWVTYRLSQISLDVSFGLPGDLDLTQLCTTTNVVPIERFEVEVTSWSNADRNRKVDLHQLDKTRVLSRAVPLRRQVLRPRQPSEGSELDLSSVHTTNDSNLLLLLLTTHFRRVHYARSTPNDQRHHSVCDSAVVLRVSVLAIHTDASQSVLGGWTSAPHLVRGRSRVQFGGGGDGTSPEKSLQSSMLSSKRLAVGPVRERARNVKAKKKKRYPSAEFIEDSDAEAGS